MNTEEITKSYLMQILDYNLITGEFIRLVSASKGKAGAVAGHIDNRGYRRIGIDNKEHLAHRLAFLFVLGYLPHNQVDHINGVRDDNRWINLRPVTRAVNAKNRRKHRTNTSGVIGVSINHTRKDGSNIWVARIGNGGRKRKYFNSIGDAILWRKQMEAELDYHPNHGSVAV